MQLDEPESGPPPLVFDSNGQWTVVKSVKLNPDCNITCEQCHKTYLIHPNYKALNIKACVANGGCCVLEDVVKSMLKARRWTFTSITRLNGGGCIVNFVCDRKHADSLHFPALRKGACCKTCFKILKVSKGKAAPLVRPDCDCKGANKKSRPRACPHYNFKLTCPDAAEDWDYSLNGDLDPTKLSPASATVAWFRCPNKNCREAYDQSLSHRTTGQQRCSYCAGKRVALSNCLATLRPDIAAQWDSSNTLLPTQVTVYSALEVTWKCDKHGKEIFTWPAKISDRSTGRGCPKCNVVGYAQLVGGHEVFVAECRLIHGDKYQYPDRYINATTKIDIYCPVIEIVHGKTIVHGLFPQMPYCHKHGDGCPKCGLPGYHQIAGGHDYFVKEARLIHGDKYEYPEPYTNCDVKIDIYCGAKTVVCGIEKVHGIFKQTPHGHKSGQGCPICAIHRRKSRAVSMLYSVLSEMGYVLNANFFAECTIPGLQYRAPLRLDGYLTDRIDNLVTEADGRQHFKMISCWGGQDAFETGQIRDIIKDLFCVRNKINLLRIPYTVKPSIELLTYVLNLCREGKHVYFTYQKYYDVVIQHCDLSNVYVRIWPM
jgi:hypothetical protein